MIIKYPALPASLKQNVHALYILIGACPFLINDAVFQIKNAWRIQGQTDESTWDLNSASDWRTLIEAANHYSLFAERSLLNAHIDKKNIDSKGKDILTTYLQNPNPQSLIILQSPQVPIKSLQWLSNLKAALVVQVFPFTAREQHQWIACEFKKHHITFSPQVPSLLTHYTKANMLACNQVIQKIVLAHEGVSHITEEEALHHLNDQSDYSLYEITEACLKADTERALYLLKRAHEHRHEPALLLWLITQEIRLLIELIHQHQYQSKTFNETCKQLKIWPKKIQFYQAAAARLTLAHLYQLIQLSMEIDTYIKTNQSAQIWPSLDQLIFEFSKKSI